MSKLIWGKDMDSKTIIELIDKLIWPLVLLLIVIIFRKPLAGLIPSITSIKYKNFEAHFEKLKNDAEKGLPGKSRLPISAVIDRFNDLLIISPNTAVSVAWAEVILSAYKLIEKKFPELRAELLNTETPFKNIQNLLRKGNLVESKQLEILNELRLIRNKIAHARDFKLDQGKAREYVTIALKLKTLLDKRRSSK